ncbi:TPM domain-containing protein [Legionella sainthelensi]|uniref:TPM domain-containing protein n=1 Tax=Legionella sainthelensi TaxID=28087 RepID=A0A2H5FIJ5_9GAMM|nr:TPM domain-containing protein [Legionella sainthelensi]AUH71356.1 TPM domain-containing protein [Legionella sainthelensi]
MILKYYQAWQRLLFIMLSLVITTSSFAINFPNKPTNDSFIVDEANLLEPTTTKQINELIFQVWNEQRIPIYVVTIPSLAHYGASGLSIEQYASELFNNWGIGSPDRNYGVLLLVSKGDRKARIELGKAYEHRYDNEATDIMQNLIIPNFKNNDYALGISEGVRGLSALVRGQSIPLPKQPWWAWPLLIGSVILITAVIVSLFKSGRRGWGWALIVLLATAIGYLLWAAAKAGGSSGGFGGGSSGGGGSTGSW